MYSSSNQLPRPVRGVFVLAACLIPWCPIEAAVFSGPQPGERTSPFQVIELRGPDAGETRNIIEEHGGTPTALVFVHGLERSMAPLMTVIDEYGVQLGERLHTEFIFLSDDRLTSEQRLPLVGRSLRMQSPMSLSVDGLEGPGNYGLNKECLLTVLVIKNKRVTANFALVQPGIADAPEILEAMAQVAGEDSPPQAAELRERHQSMRRDARIMDQEPVRSELDRMDLDSEAGLKNAVRTLIREVRALRREVEVLKQSSNPGRRERSSQGRQTSGDDIPGAVPTDVKLLSWLREYLQSENDQATIDRILREVSQYIEDDRDLKNQAIAGWQRAVHLEYGTDYAVEAGEAAIEKWQTP